MKKPAEPQFFELVADAVKEGLDSVRQLKSENKYIGTYFSWPQMSQYDNGLPSFSESLMSGPTDHKRAFGKDSNSRVAVQDLPALPAFKALLEYAKSYDDLKNYFAQSISTSIDKMIFESQISLTAEHLVDRYIHTYENDPFSVERLLHIYLPIESGIFSKKLPIDIVVPVLFLKFDFEDASLGANAKIERMSDEFQLARAPKRAYGPGVHPSVLSSATHALVLRGWELKNESYWQSRDAYSRTSVYPLRQIDRFFSAIRIATGVDTGYAQLLMRPIGWAHDYTAYLPPVEGTSIRGYPTWFENFYWLKPVPTLTSEDAAKIGYIFSELSTIEHNKLALATRRLNRCFLRENEEDSILDATIAIEVLLTDDSRQEITHKLALRMAALSKLSKDGDHVPAEVYSAIKKIYSYRSAVVHGSTKASKNREISLAGKEKVSAVTAAINYLRMALTVLINNTDYLNSKKIDEELLLG